MQKAYEKERWYLWVHTVMLIFWQLEAIATRYDLPWTPR